MQTNKDVSFFKAVNKKKEEEKGYAVKWVLKFVYKSCSYLFVLCLLDEELPRFKLIWIRFSVGYLFVNLLIALNFNYD